MAHPLASPVYTAPPDPRKCPVCKPPKWKLRLMRWGTWECSQPDCPLRKFYERKERK